MNKKIIASITLSLFVGFVSGLIVFSLNKGENVESLNCESNFTHINKLLGCNYKPIIRKHEYKQFVQSLNQYINEIEKEKKISQVSIYFRDLHNGPTFGINERENFAPASLLKVPLFITYLDKADDNPQILQKKISYIGRDNTLEQNNSTGEKPQENKPYTVDELLSKMIVDSDNLSYQILFESLKKMYPEEDVFIQTMIDFGLVNPRTPTEDTISVKAYASIFRQLYNSSYLSNEMSEKALNILSSSKYNNGLAANLPPNIKVSHKFGEREGFSENTKQLHDCGIIYYPGNPYLLCIMTTGDNFENLEEVIGKISEKVYIEVDSRKY